MLVLLLSGSHVSGVIDPETGDDVDNARVTVTLDLDDGTFLVKVSDDDTYRTVGVPERFDTRAEATERAYYLAGVSDV